MQDKTEIIPFKLNAEVTSYIPYSAYLQHKEAMDIDFIHRETLDGKVMMHASAILGIIPAGGDLNIQDLPLCRMPKDFGAKETAPKDPMLVPLDDVVITVRAKWMSAEEKPAKSSSSANFFGRYGTFELLDDIKNLVFKTVDIDTLTEESLAFFGARKLTPKNPSFTGFNTFNESLFAIVYDYDKDYLEKYAHVEALGGGEFLEAHNFPHFFKPLGPECAGSTIIGKLVSFDQENKIGTYKLISVSIKFPSAIAIESGVIHGNAGFIGPYVISSNPHGQASLALMHNKDNEMQAVTQIPYESTQRFFKPTRTSFSGTAKTSEDFSIKMTSPMQIF